MRKGTFVAVVGPSGAGKDTLLREAATALAHRPDIRFARRVITRPPDASTEDHDTLTPEAIEEARARGAFCLSWNAHGLSYGIRRSAQDQIESGDVVIANISRTVIDTAATLFNRLAVISIEAAPEVLVQRITARGRESDAQAAERSHRFVKISVPARCPYFCIDNSGGLYSSSREFTSILEMIASKKHIITLSSN